MVSQRNGASLAHSSVAPSFPFVGSLLNFIDSGSFSHQLKVRNFTNRLESGCVYKIRNAYDVSRQRHLLICAASWYVKLHKIQCKYWLRCASSTRRKRIFTWSVTRTRQSHRLEHLFASSHSPVVLSLLTKFISASSPQFEHRQYSAFYGLHTHSHRRHPEWMEKMNILWISLLRCVLLHVSWDQQQSVKSNLLHKMKCRISTRCHHVLHSIPGRMNQFHFSHFVASSFFECRKGSSARVFIHFSPNVSMKNIAIGPEGREREGEPSTQIERWWYTSTVFTNNK